MSSKVLAATDTELLQGLPWVVVEADADSGDDGDTLPLGELPWATELDDDSAQRRIERAQTEVENRVQEARREGYEQGRTEEQTTCAARIQPLEQCLRQTLERFAELEQAVRRSIENDMVELAFAIASGILRREVALDAGAIRTLARDTLERVQGRALHSVRSHPMHEPMLRGILDEAGLLARVELTVDPSLDSGDLVFETDRGELDASLKTQIEEIRRGFADVRRSAVG